MTFEQVQRLTIKYVRQTTLVIPMDEEERFHYLREVAGDFCGLGDMGKGDAILVFFIICDELGLGEAFKNLWFTNGVSNG